MDLICMYSLKHRQQRKLIRRKKATSFDLGKVIVSAS